MCNPNNKVEPPNDYGIKGLKVPKKSIKNVKGKRKGR